MHTKTGLGVEHGEISKYSDPQGDWQNQEAVAGSFVSCEGRSIPLLGDIGENP